MAVTRVIEQDTPIHTEREKVVEKSGNGALIAVVILIIFLALLLTYGLPAMKAVGRTYNPGNQINVPSKIDLNVHTNQ